MVAIQKFKSRYMWFVSLEPEFVFVAPSVVTYKLALYFFFLIIDLILILHELSFNYLYFCALGLSL